MQPIRTIPADILKRGQSALGEDIADSILRQINAPKELLADRMIRIAEQERFTEEQEAEREITRQERRAERG